MILDRLESIKSYLPMNRGFEKALEFLMKPDLKELPCGRYEIEGDKVFATVVKEPGRRREDAQLEIHRKYIDIQLVLDGTDIMGWKSLWECREPAGAFDTERDLGFFRDKVDVWIPVKGGSFAIFFPEDAHLPMVSEDILHKVIVKIGV